AQNIHTSTLMLCYSSDRQLSLDLVNVGRQRLDFLPMLEHSGTYRESAMHTGTFAQEIITLVHQVKEHYFRGDSITLNERFSAPREGVFAEEEEDDEEEQLVVAEGRPMFSRYGTSKSAVSHLQLQPLRDPGDLRHDLERKRQERLEGVKVTIPGGSLSQRPLGPRGVRRRGRGGSAGRSRILQLVGGAGRQEMGRKRGEQRRLNFQHLGKKATVVHHLNLK
uniref:Zgc:112982 n=2 Tax=Myripristis murdjan TaxID=586833 RepID=A0A667YJ24_9TELE